MSAIETIRPGIIKITPPQKPESAWESPNLYLVGDKFPTLIDSGYDDPEQVDIVMEALSGRDLERIIITHCHIDHAGGAWLLREKTGATVLAHPDEAPALERRFPGKKTDGWLEEYDKVDADGMTLEMKLFPGHARGHLCPHIEKENIFFSGDLVTGKGSSLVAPPEGQMQTYMRSLSALEELAPDLILPGHGPIVEDPRTRVRELIEHRELRELAIAKCLARGPSKLMDLVRTMYMGLIHPHLEGPAAWTAWAHIEKMMADGSVVKTPESETNPFEMKFEIAPGVNLPF